MREKFLDIWPIWNFALSRESRFGFLMAVSVVLVPSLSVFYGLTNRLMEVNGNTVWDPSFYLDHQIPFLAWTIVFYHTLYIVFYPLPWISMPDTERSRKEMLICSQAMFVTSVISCTIFAILPAEVYTRTVAMESIAANPGWYNPMYEWLWKLDTPYNAWPSLHVSTAALITIFSIHWWKERPVLQWSIGILWILMCISILTTKQHFIWDLVTGLLLTAGIWRWQIVPGLEKIKHASTEEITS